MPIAGLDVAVGFISSTEIERTLSTEESLAYLIIRHASFYNPNTGSVVLTGSLITHDEQGDEVETEMFVETIAAADFFKAGSLGGIWVVPPNARINLSLSATPTLPVKYLFAFALAP